MVGRALLLICGVLLPALAVGAETAGPAGDGGRPVPPALARVESRLAVYGEKAARWRELAVRTAAPALTERRPAEWPGCLATVENLAAGYGRLREEVARRQAPADREVPVEVALWQVLFDDLAFVEGGCEQVYQQVAGLAGGAELRAAGPAQPVEVVQKPPLGEQEQLEKWNKALLLFDAGKYDEAIAEFAALANTPQAAAAREKSREAQTVVATQLRRQAAGILARKTDDPVQKKKLLEESWLLLNRIVTAYPEAAIIDKVKQNQAQIELQLNQLDPAILPRLKGGPAAS